MTDNLTQGALTLMTETTTSPEIDLRDARLAELVAGLTGCDEHGALHAIREQGSDGSSHHDEEDPLHTEALQRVASAIVAVDRPVPDGFRVAGYLRDDLPALATR
jgi:hypothetical protein